MWAASFWACARRLNCVEAALRRPPMCWARRFGGKLVLLDYISFGVKAHLHAFNQFLFQKIFFLSPIDIVLILGFPQIFHHRCKHCPVARRSYCKPRSQQLVFRPVQEAPSYGTQLISRSANGLAIELVKTYHLGERIRRRDHQLPQLTNSTRRPQSQR